MPTSVAPLSHPGLVACGLSSRNPYAIKASLALATESDHAARGNPLESNLGAVGISERRSLFGRASKARVS